MEMLRIYKLAYMELLNLRTHEEKINKITLEEKGRENEICLNRIKKIDEEIEFLHKKIIEEERKRVTV